MRYATPEDARDFLTEFDPVSRERGMAICQRQDVLLFEHVRNKDELGFRAMVTTGRTGAAPVGGMVDGGPGITFAAIAANAFRGTRFHGADHGNADQEAAQADGRALPSVLSMLHGSPTYYITADAAYRGPALPDRSKSVNWLAQQEIPVAAIENPEGILALRTLGVALPEKLESQIRVVPVEVKISCRLSRPRKGSDDEFCIFDVTARSSDKLIQEKWTPANSWFDRDRHSRMARGAEPSKPILYDRSLQTRAVALLSRLTLRPQYDGRPALKITRNFAQTFLEWLSSVPPEIPVQLQGELATLARDPLAGRLQLQAEEVSIDWFDLKVVVPTHAHPSPRRTPAD